MPLGQQKFAKTSLEKYLMSRTSPALVVVVVADVYLISTYFQGNWLVAPSEMNIDHCCAHQIN